MLCWRIAHSAQTEVLNWLDDHNVPDGVKNEINDAFGSCLEEDILGDILTMCRSLLYAHLPKKAKTIEPRNITEKPKEQETIEPRSTAEKLKEQNELLRHNLAEVKDIIREENIYEIPAFFLDEIALPVFLEHFDYYVKMQQIYRLHSELEQYEDCIRIAEQLQDKFPISRYFEHMEDKSRQALAKKQKELVQAVHEGVIESTERDTHETNSEEDN